MATTYDRGFNNSPTGYAPQAGAQNLGQAAPGYDQLSSVFNSLLGNASPSLAFGNQQIGNLQGQLGLLGLQGNDQSSQLQSQYGFDLSKLGIQGADLGISQGALTRQLGLLPQYEGIQNEAFNAQEQADKYSALRSQQNLSGSTAARGAIGSEGYKRGVQDINTSLEQQLGSLGRERSQYNLSEGEKKASLQDQQQRLDNASKLLGINKAELQSRLSHALTQLGLSNQLQADDILRAITDVQAGQFNNIAPILGSIYQLAGIGPFQQQQG